MNFSEWLRDINVLQAKIQDSPFGTVRETINLEKETVQIVLGKGEGKAYGNFVFMRHSNSIVHQKKLEDMDLRALRPLYTNNKGSFDALLESLTTKVSQLEACTDGVINAFAADQIPGAVVSRMKGDTVEMSPQELIQKACREKLHVLIQEIDKCLIKCPISSFETELRPIIIAEEDWEIILEKDYHENISITIGAFSANSSSDPANHATGDVMACMNFLAHLEEIRTTRILPVIHWLKFGESLVK